jgi:hypothetical protein
MIVGVTTRDGTAVAGLTPRDFVVREDRIAREVLSVTPAPLPTHLAVLVDDSQAAELLITDLRQGLIRFVRRFDAPARPALALYTFGARPTRQSDFSTSLPAIENRIARIVSQPGTGSHFVDAIIDISSDLRARQAVHPVIVGFVAEEALEFSQSTSWQAEESLRSATAALWTVALRGPAQPDTQEARERARVLGDVTTASGGRHRWLLSKDTIDAAFSTVADALIGRYEVTYGRPSTLLPPLARTVEIRDRRDVEVHVSRWAMR